MVEEIPNVGPEVPAPDLSTKENAFFVRKVYFGTDRRVDGTSGTLRFLPQRADHLTYGEVAVTIPPNHERGVLNAPSIWRLELHEDPKKHFTIQQTHLLQEAALYETLATEIKKSKSSSLLVFVHGYNVTFEDAAKRTAQLAFDLRFQGAAVFFSWPSHGGIASYMADEQAIIDAEPHLEQFLQDLLARSSAENIYLIAHSMGNRGLTRALVSLAKKDSVGVKRIKEVILTAPDIGTVEFKEQIAPGLRALGAPVTLYASSNDRALAASKEIHDSDRAGESGANLVVIDGIETIDASDTDTDLIGLGHSYFAERTTVLADMYYVITQDLRADKRDGLRPQPTEIKPKYWKFVK
ncbi:alpha/beta hydrolase [Paraburkholderia terrae]|uniref:alpha/beta hydrolase n=1 Tax=Paraburkholderia terrae TaxID=311230 RepID=UPI001E64C12B|nr:alpha/beta fold hydrolase [Paraburkholderia terrae]